MPPRRLVLIALIAEAVVGCIGVLWIAVRGLRVQLGPPISSVVIGLAAAGGLALVNHWLLRSAPELPLVRSLRLLYREMLEPLFARVGGRDIVLISIAAGVCEELLFRGAVQAEWGLLPASVLFGAAHMGGSGTWGFGIWAALVGTFLGALAMLTGGLLAPILAHAAYDAMALVYIRWRAPSNHR